MRKRIIASFIVLTLVFYPFTKALGVFGIGDVVFDPSNLVQMLLDYAVQAEQLTQEILAVEQLILQVEYMALAAKNLNFSALPVVGGLIDTLTNVYENAQGIVYNAAHIKEAFDELWQPFRLEVMDGATFYGKVWDWNEQTRRAHYDVAFLQNKIPFNLYDTRMVMQEVMSRSAAAVGSLQAEQAGNELHAVVAQQLMLLNEQMALESSAQDSQRMMDAATTDQAQLNGERWMHEFTAVTETTGYNTLPKLR